MNWIPLVALSLVSAAAGFGLTRLGAPRSREELCGEGGQITSVKDGQTSAASAPQPSPAPTAKTDARPSAPEVRTLILESLFSDLSEDELETLVLAGVRYDEAVQMRFLALFLASENPFVHSLFHKGIYSPGASVMEACLEAFDREQTRERKVILAEVLGSRPLHPGILARGEKILAGTDSRLQIHLLQSWRIKWIPDDDRDRVGIRLRELVIHGDVPELRMVALQALEDDESDAGVRFFLDRVLRDSSPEIRLEALRSIPWNFGENPDVRGETLRGLYAALSENSLGPALRKKIARRLGSYLEDRKQTLFTPEEQERIKAMAESD